MTSSVGEAEPNEASLNPRLLTGVAGVWLAVAGVAMAAHGYLGWFTRYLGDDFCTAGILVANGLLESQIHWYTIWSGRFSFTFLVNLAEMVGPGIVPVLPIVAMLAWVAALAWALGGFRVRGWLVRLGVAAAVVAATLGSAPDTPQSLYWQTGMLTYVLPLILGTIWVGMAARRVTSDGTGWVGPAVGALVTFIGAGLSETYAGVQTAALGLAFVAALGLAYLDWAALRDFRAGARRALPMVTAGFVASAIGSLVVLGAPGNATRGGDYMSPGLIGAIPLTLEYLWFFVRGSMVRDAVQLGAVLLVGASLGLLAGRGALSVRRVVVEWVLLAAVTVVLVLATYYPAFLVQGSNPPTRAQMITQYIVVASILFAGYRAGLALRESKPGSMAVWASGAASLALVGVTAFTLVEVWQAAPRSIAYAERWDALDSGVRAVAATGAQRVLVPLLEVNGNVAGFDFAAASDDNWLNVCAARYYGIASLAADPDVSTPRAR